MLVSVKDVAERLKISNRAVQIKCKREGLIKIGNQYQITNEIADKWSDNSEAKQRNEHEHTRQSSHPKQRTGISFVIYILIAFIIALLVLFYINLDTQILDLKTEAIKTKTEHKAEVKHFTKKLNDAQDVIQNQEIEIQSLKLKDSLRYIKRW